MDELNLYKKIVKSQDDLISSFDEWVRVIKLNDLECASKVVIKANKLRLDITELKKQLEKLNKKSVIITKLN